MRSALRWVSYQAPTCLQAHGVHLERLCATVPGAQLPAQFRPARRRDSGRTTTAFVARWPRGEDSGESLAAWNPFRG